MKQEIVKDRRAEQRRSAKDRRQVQTTIKRTDRRENKDKRGEERRTQALPPQYVLRKKKTKKLNLNLYFIIFFVCVLIALTYTIVSNKVKETILSVGKTVIKNALEEGKQELIRDIEKNL